MGLTFNCEIIRRHGGSMGVKRIRPHGSIFMIRLPYIKDPSQMRKALAKEASDKGFRILFVDDEEPLVRMFEKGLSLLGQTVLAATSGQQAVEIFKTEKVDAIVCDLAMPEMNGRQVAAAIRRVADDKGILKPPFMILSGHASPADEEETLAHPGIDRFLQKPITVPKLLEAISDEVQKATGHSSFSGRIEGIDLLEYLQLLILNARKLVLEITPRDGAAGLIYVKKGEICHAECGKIEGEEALYECLTFKGGTFSSHPWRDPEKITIKRPAQFLLIQAARRRDELRSKQAEEHAPEDDDTTTTDSY
jgi:CheY-like chemotaxis protein